MLQIIWPNPSFDAVIDYPTPLGLIPSRRQVDHESGYVNGWVTETFCNYVRSKTDKVLLVRDHGGPNQGYKVDNGIESFLIDCQNFDIYQKMFEYSLHRTFHEISSILQFHQYLLETQYIYIRTVSS